MVGSFLPSFLALFPIQECAIHQRFSGMNLLLSLLFSLSFRHGTAHNLKSLYTLSLTEVPVRDKRKNYKNKICSFGTLQIALLSKFRGQSQSALLSVFLQNGRHNMLVMFWKHHGSQADLLSGPQKGLCMSQSESSETCCLHRSREGNSQHMSVSSNMGK